MNVRLSILLVVVLILIGGSVAITYGLRDKEPTEKDPWLFKVGFEDIMGIQVAHAGEQIEFATEDGEKWVIKDGEDTPVFRERWSGIPFLLSGPRCDRAVSETIEDPAAYGLDDPQTIVQLTIKGNQTLVFHLGNPTPDGSAWYARLENDDRLCSLAAVWGEVVSGLAVEPPYPPSLGKLGITVEDIVRFGINHGGNRVEYRLLNDQWVFIDGRSTPVFEDAWRGPELLLEGLESTKILATYVDDPGVYGLTVPTTRVQMVNKEEEVIEYLMGEPVPNDDTVYAYLVGSESLYSVPAAWASSLAELVTSPPYPPDAEAGS
jgi:hypothetical protein